VVRRLREVHHGRFYCRSPERTELPAASRDSSVPPVESSAVVSKHEALLVGLTFASGVVDAVSYLGLGHIFTANMTGNVVFLALAVGERNLPTALHSSVALIGFSVGAVTAGLILVRPRPPGVWPRRATWLLWGELASLLAFALLWASQPAPSTGDLVYLLIVLSSVGMGFQNAAARHLAVPRLTTTVVTGALTEFMVDLPALGVSGTVQRRAVWAVGMLFSGAAVGATLTVFARPVAPFVTVVVVAGVVVAAHLSFHKSDPDHP
jgi:uncharacterized membrane protein YoaK (UPF0700 family)